MVLDGLKLRLGWCCWHQSVGGASGGSRLTETQKQKGGVVVVGHGGETATQQQKERR